jgi:hypothetical protein
MLSVIFERWGEHENVGVLGKRTLEIWWWCEFETKVLEEYVVDVLKQQKLELRLICRVRRLKPLRNLFKMNYFMSYKKIVY